MYPYNTQLSEVQCLNKILNYYIEENYEIVMADETLFNPDRYAPIKHWMMTKSPILKVKRYCDKEKINVCCVIHETLGNVYNHYGPKYFSSKDMTEVLTAVRNAFDKDTKVVCFWDGASIHKSEEIRNFAKREEINIALITNIRYRCDLQPVEKVFRRAKHDFAKELEIYKSLNHPWTQQETVKYIMEQIPQDFYRAQARKLKKLVEEALPTEPLMTEEQLKLGFVEFECSPDKHYLEDVIEDVVEEKQENE